MVISRMWGCPFCLPANSVKALKDIDIILVRMSEWHYTSDDVKTARAPPIPNGLHKRDINKYSRDNYRHLNHTCTHTHMHSFSYGICLIDHGYHGYDSVLHRFSLENIWSLKCCFLPLLTANQQQQSNEGKTVDIQISIMKITTCVIFTPSVFQSQSFVRDITCLSNNDN